MLNQPIDSGYILPFKSRPAKVLQGWHGGYSHFSRQIGRFVIDDSYAIDFELPLRSEIIAARAGIATGIVDWIKACYKGLDFKIGASYPGNHIEIRHDDGSYAYYEHLELGSISPFIEEGSYVEQGKVIGLLGQSGWIGPTPHLHFEVYERGIEGFMRKSLPVSFRD